MKLKSGKLIVIPILALAFTAAICNKSDDSSSIDLKKKELELKEKELILKEKELDLQAEEEIEIFRSVYHDFGPCAYLNGSEKADSFKWLVSGKQSLCNGCPDMTVWNCKLVYSCRMEEQLKYGYNFRTYRKDLNKQLEKIEIV